MVFWVRVFYPLEVRILPHIGHGGQDFRKALLAGCRQQYFFEYRPVFRLRTPPMPGCALLECMDDTLVKMPDHKVCHISALLYKPDDCNDSKSSKRIAIIDSVALHCEQVIRTSP
jgi:hypothetical protein